MQVVSLLLSLLVLLYLLWVLRIVTIQYLPFDSGKKLPEAASCFCVLYLPVCNQSKEEFVASFDKALVLGRVGFRLN